MRSDVHSPLGPYNIDRQLIAAVQINAGAHCHQSANLLNYYYLSAESYQRAVTRKDEEEAQCALKSLEDSEVNLRKFLFRCRHPAA